MKNTVLKCGVLALAAVGVIKYVNAGDVAFSLGFDEESVMPSAINAALLSTVQPRHPGKWIVNNYDNRITISVKEIEYLHNALKNRFERICEQNY